METSQRPVPLVERVEISNLFGHKKYTLNFSGGISDEGNISILYGDNGSGKTTVLRLIYSVLARHGHGTKSHVAATPFSKLRIALSDGNSVLVEKEMAAEVELSS